MQSKTKLDSLVANLREVFPKLDRVAILVTDPPRENYTSWANAPICDSSLYVAVTCKPQICVKLTLHCLGESAPVRQPRSLH